MSGIDYTALHAMLLLSTAEPPNTATPHRHIAEVQPHPVLTNVTRALSDVAPTAQTRLS